MLKEITIQSLATEAAYARGCRDYKAGRVRGFQEKNAPLPTYEAFVANDGQGYSKAGVVLSRSGNSVESYSCDCPSAAVHLEACHHVVALLKAVQSEQKEHGNPHVEESRSSAKRELQRRDYAAGERMLRIFDDAASEEGVPQILRLEPHLIVQNLYYRRICWLEFRIGQQKLYVMRNLQDFMRYAEEGREMKFGKDLTDFASDEIG